MSKQDKTISSLADLTPDPANARRHNPRNVGMLVDSLHQVGAARSIVVDENGVVLAGNATIEAAAEAGIHRVKTIEADGSEIVAVVRRGLSKEQKTKLALYDNRVAELAEWNPDILSQLVETKELEGMFSDKELAEILTQTGVEPKDAEPQIDKAEELRQKWGTESGQLWVIGNHRLLVGDSTQKADVAHLCGGKQAQLVFTDPPYGVNYDGGAKKRELLENDHIGSDIYGQSLPHLKWAADDQAALYLWYADGHVAAAAAAAAAAGYVITAQIVWLKNNAQFVTSAHYKGKHEPCFYAHRKGKSARWYGPNNEVTVWECDRAQSNDFHPTQKPVALAARAIKNSSKAGDIVLDLFLGGGTTMVASENEGRTCWALEIKPEYAAVTLQRMYDCFPHLKIERVDRAEAA